MVLHIGNVQGYNNEIVIVGSDAVTGHNPGINESEPISGTKAIRHSKGISPHQPGLFTRDLTPLLLPTQSVRNTQTCYLQRASTNRRRAQKQHQASRRLSALPAHLRCCNNRRRARRRKSSPRYCWNCHQPSGALVCCATRHDAALGSPEPLRETESLQQCPQPTNDRRSKPQSYPVYSRAKRQLSQ